MGLGWQGKEWPGTLPVEEHFLYCKMQFCITREQYELTLESLCSGFFTDQTETTQSPVVFNFQLSETKRKPFAFS